MEEKQLVNLVGAGNTESQEKLKTDSLFYTRCLETSEKINWRPYHFGFSNSTGLFNWIKFLC